MIVSYLFRLYSLYSRFSYIITTITFNSLTLFYFRISDSFTDMTQSTDIEAELTGKLSSSFSYNAIKSEAVAIESDSYSELFLAVSNMRIDRYFSGFKTSSIMMLRNSYSIKITSDFLNHAEQTMYAVSAVHRKLLQSSSSVHQVEIWHKSLLLK